MDTLLRVALIAVLGCTSLKSGDERLDSGDERPDVGLDAPDAFDAPPDTFDACADPPIGDCPPICMRERRTAGIELGGVGNIVGRDETWHCGVLWVLEEDTYVDNTSVLTIQAGTVIEAMPGTSLIVRDGSRIVVEGEADAPVRIRPPVDYESG